MGCKKAVQEKDGEFKQGQRKIASLPITATGIDYCRLATGTNDYDLETKLSTNMPYQIRFLDHETAVGRHTQEPVLQKTLW